MHEDCQCTIFISEIKLKNWTCTVSCKFTDFDIIKYYHWIHYSLFFGVLMVQKIVIVKKKMYKIGMILRILNIEGYKNCIIDSKVQQF